MASRFQSILAMIRLHHWPKNLIIFVPLLINHEFQLLAGVRDATLAFFSFSLLASATYIFNDLRDTAHDRKHPVKRQRPLASGALKSHTAIIAMFSLVLASAAIARMLPYSFGLALGAYLVGSVAYTLLIKRMLGLDIVLIACLYVVRVIAGDEAIGLDTIGLDSSDWILGFSCMLFLCLALIKRCCELSFLAEDQTSRLAGRAYRGEDIPVMLALAASAAMASIAIFSRYVGSPEVTANFAHPRFLWIIVPILAYWMIRLILLANRRKISVDPVLFTFQDSKSLMCGGVVLATLLAAW